MNDSVYQIDKVKIEDTGRYTCIADNGAGHVSQDFYLKVQCKLYVTTTCTVLLINHNYALAVVVN